MQLPDSLYTAEQSRQLDDIAIRKFGLGEGVLMQRAGAAAYSTMRHRWPQAKRIAVVCGPGNNGGDGYVVAHLAQRAGLTVSVLTLGDAPAQGSDALAAIKDYQAQGGKILAFAGALPAQQDVIIDALFGIGLVRPVAGEWAEAIAAMNKDVAPVLALDIASGLHADNGRVLGCAVVADATISFIGLKAGMFTADGPDHCGHVYYHDLDLPGAAYDSVTPFAKRIQRDHLRQFLPQRKRNTHKGQYGRVLLIGGGPNMSGAVQLAAEAALYTGAGLVTIATHPDHARTLVVARPELIVHGIATAGELSPLITAADVIAIGPGLGQSEWAQRLLALTLQSSMPKVLDADALNLLAHDACRSDNWILTPHPGEAATLLDVTSSDIQQDRFRSTDKIVKKYGGICVLKGAGTIIGDGHSRLVSDGGNAALSVAATGDLLTGAIASFVAQGLEPMPAVATAVWVHGRSAEIVAPRGQRGWLATDFLPAMRAALHSLES